MQVALLQTIFNDIVVHIVEARAEVKKYQLDEIKEKVKKYYIAYSDFEVITAYILDDYRIEVQLYNEKVRKYVFVVL